MVPHTKDEDVSLTDEEIPCDLHSLRFSDLFVGPDVFEVKVGPRQLYERTLYRHLCNPEQVWKALLERCEACYAEADRQEFTVSYDTLTFRVSRISTRNHQGVFVMRRIPAEVPSLDSLGLPDYIYKRLTRRRLTGLIILSGSVGSGKTTTASALMADRLTKESGVCLAVEDPPEMPLEGDYPGGRCYQVTVKDQDFATPLRHSLRMSPDFLYIGEIRDPVSAVEAIRASLSGHLVISTIHSHNVSSAITRLYSLAAIEVGSEDASSMLSNGLSAVIHQRLTRGTGRLSIRAEMLWLSGDENTGSRSLIAKRQFHQIDSEVNSQGLRLQNDGGEDT
ncbi:MULTISPECIES: ATPase, T2SS/T4P/T4SS family [unclassified Thioalkalivibrio]|uniref:ATPase, T2SS/T4P/T4SS family n=1 Tax=unclassified Thioalkalivibrio TaxID=2621013 RepID=UPI00035CBE5E|nr:MULTISPECIES: ATPase, T2SS/T4P/T4SS family [unclassified Thioalkalivibrio]